MRNIFFRESAPKLFILKSIVQARKAGETIIFYSGGRRGDGGRTRGLSLRSLGAAAVLGGGWGWNGRARAPRNASTSLFCHERTRRPHTIAIFLYILCTFFHFRYNQYNSLSSLFWITLILSYYYKQSLQSIHAHTVLSLSIGMNEPQAFIFVTTKINTLCSHLEINIITLCVKLTLISSIVWVVLTRGAF